MSEEVKDHSDVYTDDVRCASHADDLLRLFNALKIEPVPLPVIILSVQVFERTDATKIQYKMGSPNPCQ